MKYTIYHGETVLPSGKTGFGLEVQGPLITTAEAVATVLGQQPKGFTTGREHLVEEATVTRNDLEGTAFLVTPNDWAYTKPHQPA